MNQHSTEASFLCCRHKQWVGVAPPSRACCSVRLLALVTMSGSYVNIGWFCTWYRALMASIPTLVMQISACQT